MFVFLVFNTKEKCTVFILQLKEKSQVYHTRWEVCMWKTNGLYVMLGTEWTWTARTLDVFLELKPRSTPAAVLSYDSPSCPSCVLWEDLFFVFLCSVSRPLLKNKPRLRNGTMTDDHYLSASSLLKTTQTLPGKKCYLFKKRGGGQWEGKGWGLLLENVGAVEPV